MFARTAAVEKFSSKPAKNLINFHDCLFLLFIKRKNSETQEVVLNKHVLSITDNMLKLPALSQLYFPYSP